MSKWERVEATLNHQPVDRVALLEQLSYNPRVIADWTGKKIEGFNYTLDDICEVCRKTMDIVMPPDVSKLGTGQVTTPDGWVFRYDNWTVWTVARPFGDEQGARCWLEQRLKDLQGTRIDEKVEEDRWRLFMSGLQQKLGETLILAYPFGTGLCSLYGDSGMGLEIFAAVLQEYPEMVSEFISLNVKRNIARLHAIADVYRQFSPVAMIAEDFAAKHGSIFSPRFLEQFHYPHVRALTAAWHEHGIKVLYHSDGNYKDAIPNLIACGVDGFYCLEPSAGMDIVELKNRYPEMVWAGGVDGVDLMERGTPEQVRAEVRRHIRETNAQEEGGMFVASSSEINPLIPAENFRAMVEAVGAMPHRQVADTRGESRFGSVKQ